MEKKECEVCKKLVKEKYKHYRVWQALSIVFICLTVLFAVLYFASGDMFVEEITENDIVVKNGNGVNENNIITGNDSTISGTVKSESNIGIIILVSAVILAGGIVCGCYFVSKKKNDKPYNDN